MAAGQTVPTLANPVMPAASPALQGSGHRIPPFLETRCPQVSPLQLTFPGVF